MAYLKASVYQNYYLSNDLFLIHGHIIYTVWNSLKGLTHIITTHTCNDIII